MQASEAFTGVVEALTGVVVGAVPPASSPRCRLTIRLLSSTTAGRREVS